jgi:hypothetical protein
MSSMGTSFVDASKLSRPEKCCLLQHSESIGWLKRQKRYARRYWRSSALIQPNPKSPRLMRDAAQGCTAERAIDPASDGAFGFP